MAVKFNEYVFDMIPWVEDEKALIKGEAMAVIDRDYFIVAKTINGGRFYSRNMSWSDTTEEFRKYKSTVKFFGGGIIQLYERTFDDYEIIRDEVVW